MKKIAAAENSNDLEMHLMYEELTWELNEEVEASADNCFRYSDAEWAKVSKEIPQTFDESDIRGQLEKLGGIHLASNKLAELTTLMKAHEAIRKKQWRRLAQRARKLLDSWPAALEVVLDEDGASEEW